MSSQWKPNGPMKNLQSLNGLGDDVLFVQEGFQPSTTLYPDLPVKQKAENWLTSFLYVLNAMIKFIVRAPIDGKKGW